MNGLYFLTEYAWLVIAAVAAAAFVIVLAGRVAARKPGGRRRAEVKERVDAAGAAGRLAGAIRCKTVSYPDFSKNETAEWKKLHAFLEASYPLTHQTLSREVTETNALVYFWKGADETLEPVALLAHQDVVPVNEQNWSVPPFEGVIKDGYVYGRGALDMKGQLVAIFEAVEHLLREGFAPVRGVYLLFGCDEETMGEHGAKQVAALLESRGVRLHCVLDEGGAIQDGMQMGVPGTIALVGICEKGIMNVRLTAKGQSGHASMPPDVTAAQALAGAVTALGRHPMKARIGYAAGAMFDTLAPYMKPGFKFLFANRKLFGGLIRSVLGKKPASAALVRTTFAPTQLSGSNAPNILAAEASVVYNIRVAPGEDKEDVLAHIQKYAPGLERQTLFYNGPSPDSRVDTPAYKAVAAAVEDAFPEMVVAPYPVVAATDARYYYNICDNVFRFVPFPSLQKDLHTIHGDDERMEIASLGRGIGFFMHLVRTVCGVPRTDHGK